MERFETCLAQINIEPFLLVPFADDRRSVVALVASFACMHDWNRRLAAVVGGRVHAFFFLKSSACWVIGFFKKERGFEMKGGSHDDGQLQAQSKGVQMVYTCLTFVCMPVCRRVGLVNDLIANKSGSC